MPAAAGARRELILGIERSDYMETSHCLQRAFGCPPPAWEPLPLDDDAPVPAQNANQDTNYHGYYY